MGGKVCKTWPDKGIFFFSVIQGIPYSGFIVLNIEISLPISYVLAINHHPTG
jgi:hypothetical protein